jgi:hypothetical protein
MILRANSFNELLFVTEMVFLARQQISFQKSLIGTAAGVRFLAEVITFFYTTASGSDLGSTQPPIRWAPGLFPRR